MSRNFKKTLALVCALAMVASITSVLNAVAVETTDSTEYTEFPYVMECEDPEIANGNETWTNIYGTEFEGYSGDGFVYLTGNSIKLEVTVPEDDMYEVKVRYTQVLTPENEGRMQTISVNGTDYMVNFPYADSWTDISFGTFRLKAGVNTIEIKPQYGYASYDTITVDKADFPDLDVTPTLSDSKATSQTQSLMNYLCSVYGNGILSGQQEIYGGGNDGDYELEFDYIENLTGELPAIRGFDFMNYNPLYGWDDGTTERIIEWVNGRNGIATACWHINVPKDFSSYELGDSLTWTDCTYTPDSTDFDTNNAVIEGTKEYEYFMLAVEDLAEQLLRLQDAGVPIILRPLHEAEGNSNTDGSGSWFWWGKGGAETYKQLWKLLYDTLTEDYGIHNVIWEYNSYDYTTSAQWYPGDDYVDIVGYDKYNTVYNRHDGLSSGPNLDAVSSTFYSLVNLTDGKKLVSMPENDTIPSIENMQTEKAGWLYFCPWYGEHILDSEKNDPESVKAIYQNDYCINLGDLPADLYTASETVDPDTTTTTTEPDTTTAEPSTTTSSADSTTTSSVDTTTTEGSIVTDAPLSETTVETAVVSELEGNTLTVRFTSTNEYASYTLTDEEVAKYPTNSSDLINTYVEVELPLLEGSDEYDFENPIHVDLQVREHGYVTSVDGDQVTITLDDGQEFTLPDSSSSTSTVGDYVILAYNERTGEARWFDRVSKAVTSTTTDTTTTDSEPTDTTTSGADTTTTTTIDAGGLGDSGSDALIGDVNGDGSVDGRDLILLKKYVLGLTDQDGIHYGNADVTQNGEVDGLDLIRLKKYNLGLIDQL